MLLVVVATLVAVAGENARRVMSGDPGGEKAWRSLALWVDVVSSPAAVVLVADDEDEDEGNDEDEDNEGEDDDGEFRANSNSLISLSTSLDSLSFFLASLSILSLFASSAAEYIASPNPKSMEWLSCCE